MESFPDKDVKDLQVARWRHVRTFTFVMRTVPHKVVKVLRVVLFQTRIVPLSPGVNQGSLTAIKFRGKLDVLDDRLHGFV